MQKGENLDYADSIDRLEFSEDSRRFEIWGHSEPCETLPVKTAMQNKQVVNNNNYEKQLYSYFKQKTCQIAYEKTRLWLRMGNIKRETESQQIAANNNSIKTNYIKTKINYTQQSNKCRLCWERDVMINPIVSRCAQLVHKEFTTRHDWVATVIHCELCKRVTFEYTDK